MNLFFWNDFCGIFLKDMGAHECLCMSAKGKCMQDQPMAINVAQEHQQLVGEMYHDYKPWLYGWLCKKLGSTLDAADLAQDTFAKLLTKTELKQVLEPRAYLTTIAHGLMVSHLRRRDLERAYQATLADPALAEYPSPEVQAMAMELLVAIDHMLHGLSPKVRAAYLMMQLDGLTYAEIAQKLDISVKTVGVYIAKAVFHCISFGQEKS